MKLCAFFLLLLLTIPSQVSCRRKGPPPAVQAKFAELDRPKNLIADFNEAIEALELPSEQVPVLIGPIHAGGGGSDAVIAYLEGRVDDPPSFYLSLEIRSNDDLEFLIPLLNKAMQQNEFEQIRLMILAPLEVNGALTKNKGLEFCELHVTGERYRQDFSSWRASAMTPQAELGRGSSKTRRIPNKSSDPKKIPPATRDGGMLD